LGLFPISHWLGTFVQYVDASAKSHAAGRTDVGLGVEPELVPLTKPPPPYVSP
jgi:hypothetical protein